MIPYRLSILKNNYALKSVSMQFGIAAPDLVRLDDFITAKAKRQVVITAYFDQPFNPSVTFYARIIPSIGLLADA
jgi:hypothetical protein